MGIFLCFLLLLNLVIKQYGFVWGRVFDQLLFLYIVPKPVSFLTWYHLKLFFSRIFSEFTFLTSFYSCLFSSFSQNFVIKLWTVNTILFLYWIFITSFSYLHFDINCKSKFFSISAFSYSRSIYFKYSIFTFIFYRNDEFINRN